VSITPVPKSAQWTRLPVDGERCFIYSPRFGRTYLLPLDVAAHRSVPPLLGLKAAEYRKSLVDPAERIALVVSAGKTVRVGWLTKSLYVLFHRHRALFSIDRAMRLSRWLARFGPKHHYWGPADVGNVVMAVERSLGISDCYPRALVTSYLCMTAHLSCEVTVGILSPTAKMHAWCSTHGAIPYEPHPQHWFYSPLIVFGFR
jgi:hypothetical protein